MSAPLSQHKRRTPPCWRIAQHCVVKRCTWTLHSHHSTIWNVLQWTRNNCTTLKANNNELSISTAWIKAQNSQRPRQNALASLIKLHSRILGKNQWMADQSREIQPTEKVTAAAMCVHGMVTSKEFTGEWWKIGRQRKFQLRQQADY